MTLISNLHQQWLNDPEYQAAYEAQRPEFEIASAIIAARSQANLTQKELAELMSAKQSLIARLGVCLAEEKFWSNQGFFARNCPTYSYWGLNLLSSVITI